MESRKELIERLNTQYPVYIEHYYLPVFNVSKYIITLKDTPDQKQVEIKDDDYYYQWLEQYVLTEIIRNNPKYLIQFVNMFEKFLNDN